MPQGPSPKEPATHPRWVRLTHWLNAVAVIIMMLSGWQIYDANPLFNFRFPGSMALGGWLGGALLWHFAAMWLLVVNGAAYLVLNLLSGRLRRRFLPVNLRTLWRELGLTLRLKLSHADLSHYNMLQKLAYLIAMLDAVLLVCSGLVLWKPVQFPWLRTLMGDYDTARYVHFTAMAVMAGFILVHVLLVLIVPRTLLGMTLGRFELARRA